MRGAPPVQLDCARDARWRGLEAGLAGLAAGTLAAWAMAHTFSGDMTSARASATALVAAVLAAWAWWRAADGRRRQGLHWDGSAWRLDGVEGALTLKLDAGRWVLLRFRPHSSHGAMQGAGRARWLPLDLARSAAPLSLSRAALQAHALDRPSGRIDG